MTVDGSLADLRVLDSFAQSVIVTDTAGRVLAWNAAAERLYGYSQAEILGRGIVEILVNPEDTEVGAAIMARVIAGGTWRGEFAVRRKDGSTFLAHVTDTPLRDAAGEVVGIVGVSEDVSDTKLAAVAAEDRERRLRLALSAGQLGTWQYDQATGIVTWDERLEAIYGLAPGEFPGTYDAYLSLLYPDEREEVVATVVQATTRGGRFRVRHRVRWRDGTVRWVEGHGQATADAAGNVTGAIGCSRDVTETVVAAQRAERLRRLTEDLATTYTVAEVGDVVRGYAREVLGAVRGSLMLVDGFGRNLVPVAEFGYPAGVPGALRAVRLAGDTLAAAAVRTATARYLRTAEDLRPGDPADPAGSGSGGQAFLPLVAGGTPVGVLALGFAGERAFDDQERDLLVTLAGQTGLAVERARLVARLRHISGHLQQGLAPDAVPRVAGLELAARYRPGGDELEEVGGDWYDVVPHEDGRASLVVGDVMGRGAEAAADMIRLRSAVRAYATDDPDPSRVLARLDRLVTASGEDSFVTLLCALVDPATGRVQVTSAGHLPALLAGPGGGVSWVGLPPSPPVGLARGPRPAATFTLPAGTTLLAFTDGLVERPGRSIDDGLTRLAEAAGTLGERGLALGELLAHLVGVLAPDDSGDDVTALAVRLSP